MSTTRIHRYFIKEITVPTGLGLMIFTFVLLMGRILKLVEMVINKGVPFTETAKLFAYLLPAFLVITLPLALLLGILLGFGRLSTDSEIVALKSSGVSLYGMMKPVIALALLVCIATGALTLFLEPAGNSAFRNQVFQIATNRASIGIQPRVFNEEFDELVLYTNELDERSGVMEGVFISDERVGSTPSVILAQRGRIISQREIQILTLRLENGTIHRQPTGEGQSTYQIIAFDSYDVNLNMGQQLPSSGSRRIKDSELTNAQILEARQKASTPAERNSYTVELHKRFILPLAPLVFALIGVPLGIQSHRSGRGGGFTLALIIFLIYYLLLSLAETLAIEGGFSPVPALWLPTFLFLAGGAYLLHLAALERRLAWLDRLLEIPLRLKRRLGRKDLTS
jgi:lipopolysaccharide export system permease protein